MKFKYHIPKLKLGYRDHQGIEQSLEIDILMLEGCPGCGHVPTPDEIEYEFIYPASRDRTIWNAVCTNGGGGGCGWELLAGSPEAALAKWNHRMKKNQREKEHVCVESKFCSCRMDGLEPDENCPFHGAGQWPPRCEICGQFMNRGLRK